MPPQVRGHDAVADWMASKHKSTDGGGEPRQPPGDVTSALGLSEARYRMLVAHAPVCIHTISLDGELTSMNPAGLAMMGVTDESQVCGVRYLDVVVDEERDHIAGLLERACAGEASSFEFTMKGDPPRSFASSFIPIRNDSGTLVMLTGVTQEITERRRTERELSRKSALLEATLENVSQGISMTDADLNIVAFNRRFLELLEFPPHLFEQGDPFEKFIRYNAERGEYGPGDPDALVAERIALARQAEAHEFERSRPDGTVIEIRGKPIPGGGFVTTYTDVTERRRLSERLTHQATHDALTGLVNRWGFEQRLERVLESGADDTAQHALCYVDLDHFKVINDTCGHVAGDELLRQLSAAIAPHVRTRDTLARLGGDEFGILLEHCSVEQAKRVAEDVRGVVDAFSFAWKDRTFRVGASIGLVPIIAGDTAQAVFQAADTACYAAKEHGGSRVHVYGSDDALLVRRHGEMQWVSRIHDALEHDRFRLYFQRVVPVSDRDGATHIELLLRMLDDDGRTIPPSAFLPAAERFALARRLDRWVVSSALSAIGENPALLPEGGTCSINLSGQSLDDERFADHVVSCLGAVPADRICFEITETTAVANLTAARSLMETLKGLGCRFALDDFGTGVASFGYLKSLPIDYLKIDGSFVRDIDSDPVDLAMVKSINEIGHLTGKRTIAEFVERPGVLSLLSEIGVDYAQGYGVHRPEPLLGEASTG